jgi:hypothetical protein
MMLHIYLMICLISFRVHVLTPVQWTHEVLRVLLKTLWETLPLALLLTLLLNVWWETQCLVLLSTLSQSWKMLCILAPVVTLISLAFYDAACAAAACTADR